jgi:hypothetical protein
VSNRVDRALRALREGQSGESPDAEKTLESVLAELRAVKRSPWQKARWGIPIAAVLALSTAALAHWQPFASPRDPAPRPSALAAFPRDPAPRPSGLALPPELSPSASLDAPAPSREAPVSFAPARPSQRVSRSVATASPVAVAPLATAPIPTGPLATAPLATAPLATAGEDSAEAEAYTRAHRLHFDGADPAAALAAWDDYLRHFPEGRFAPDARYNRAIALLKLRRYAEAREALQPFADGVYAGYHRDDARRLLRSVP